ncbi:MAG: hypothetical protein KDA81_12785 [Planctomycetaceae bacterium]|nr:hypothetical protein [Planctomycetaceae bacterium]
MKSMTVEAAIEELLVDLTSWPAGAGQFWLAICGPPGSGKSTLAARLNDNWMIRSVVIPMDGYHYYRSQLNQMPDPVEAHRRRGAPFTFDAERFVSDLTLARHTGVGQFPSFDHGHGDPTENAITLHTETQLVIVEGNYLLLPEAPWGELKPIFHRTWFLDVSLFHSQFHLVMRHLMSHPEMDVAAAERRVDENDLPNAKLIHEHCRHRADRILTEGPC